MPNKETLFLMPMYRIYNYKKMDFSYRILNILASLTGQLL